MNDRNIFFLMKVIAMTKTIVMISLFVHPVIQDVMMNNIIVASDMITYKEIEMMFSKEVLILSKIYITIALTV